MRGYIVGAMLGCTDRTPCGRASGVRNPVRGESCCNPNLSGLLNLRSICCVLSKDVNLERRRRAMLEYSKTHKYKALRYITSVRLDPAAATGVLVHMCMAYDWTAPRPASYVYVYGMNLGYRSSPA